MSAFSEIQEGIWEENRLEKVKFQRVSENYFEKGERVMKSHAKFQYKSIKAVAFTVMKPL